GGGEANMSNDSASDPTTIVQPPPLTCAVTAALTQVLRQESGTDPGGGIIIACTGGVPTPAGMPLPVEQFVVGFSPPATVGGRILSGTSTPVRGEALALVDEPGGFLPTSSPNQMVCADPTLSCSILATGSGVGDYDGSAGRPNIFQS